MRNAVVYPVEKAGVCYFRLIQSTLLEHALTVCGTQSCLIADQTNRRLYCGHKTGGIEQYIVGWTTYCRLHYTTLPLIYLLPAFLPYAAL